VDDVCKLIPHRPPFLFLDEILERDARHIRAVKTLHPEEPYLAGHYPGRPLMPGVLICECVFQAGAALLFGRGPIDPKKVPVLSKIQNARFRRPVFPGARLVIEAEIVEEVMNALIMRGSVSVDGQNVLRTEFVVTMAAVEAPLGDAPAVRSLT
jgi:3-hydroxyacyl-[acyl-carrier-protein] dehydratase